MYQCCPEPHDTQTTNVITAIIDEAIRRIRKLLPQGGKSNITAANIGNKIGKEVKC